MRRAILVLLPFALAACPPPVIAPEETAAPDDSDTNGGSVAPPVDADGDGYTECRPGDDPETCDCDDTTALINPGQQEIWYDGGDVDENCDGNTADQDGDGHAWWGMNLGTDCDDEDPNISPDALNDAAYDGIDTNCDQHCDYDSDFDGEAAPAADFGGTYANNVATNWNGTFTYCEDGFDCDDQDAEVFTGADEVFDAVDNDCDGQTESLSVYGQSIQVVGPNANSDWGTDLVCVDVDNDSHDEVWAGANGLLVGMDGANLSAFTGASVNYASDAVKVSASSGFPEIGVHQVLGDLNRDGKAELLLGVPSSTHRDILVMSHSQLSGGNITADALTVGIAGGTTYSLLDGGLAVLDGSTKTVVVAGDPANGTVLGYFASGVQAGTTDDQAHLIINGADPGDNFGVALAGVDLLNDDGIPELVIGSPRDDSLKSNAGSAYVMDGTLLETGATRDVSTLFSIQGDQTNHHFGIAVQPVGDFDGDGTPDVAIAEVSAGVTWRLVEGGDTNVFNLGSSQITPAIKVQENDVFAVAHADLDGDGKSEVFVGDGDCVYAYSGQALFQGGTFTTNNAQAKVCDTSVSDFASSVAVGDVTGDGSLELLLASPNDTSGAGGRGAVYILQTGTNWDL